MACELVKVIVLKLPYVRLKSYSFEVIIGLVKVKVLKFKLKQIVVCKLVEVTVSKLNNLVTVIMKST